MNLEMSATTPRLCAPLQVAPVTRSMAETSLSTEGGVVPSQNWQQLLQAGIQALPSILSMF
jgi:hypothetical protein